MKHVLKNVSYFALTFNEAWQMLPCRERGIQHLKKRLEFDAAYNLSWASRLPV